MALLFCDSFDHYDTTHLPEKWDTIQSTPSITANGRNTSSTYNNCLNLSTFDTIGKNLTNSTTLTIGFAFNPNLLDGTNNTILAFNDSTQQQCIITMNGSAQLVITNGNGTILGATTSPVIFNNTYTYVEVSITFSTSSSGSCSIQINGSSVLSVTGVVTAVSANSYANAIYLYGNRQDSDTPYYVDDLYICDGTGTVNTTFLGDVRVALALPSGNGRLSQWTRTGGTSSGNYTAVNEVPPNDDTSYVSSSTVGQIDAYAISSIGTVASIVAVQLVASARKNDAASRSIGLGFGNSTTDNFDSGHSISSSYLMYRRTMDTNPITSTNWAATDLASAQIALKVIS